MFYVVVLGGFVVNLLWSFGRTSIFDGGDSDCPGIGEDDADLLPWTQTGGGGGWDLRRSGNDIEARHSSITHGTWKRVCGWPKQAEQGLEKRSITGELVFDSLLSGHHGDTSPDG